MRVTGRIDGDLIAVSDRATLGSTARVGGDLRYGDERPAIARGARVGGTVSKEDFDDALAGWGWISWVAWWLAVSVSTLIVGALLVWLAPAALYAAERAVRERLGATIGFDLLVNEMQPDRHRVHGHTFSASRARLRAACTTALSVATS